MTVCLDAVTLDSVLDWQIHWTFRDRLHHLAATIRVAGGSVRVIDAAVQAKCAESAEIEDRLQKVICYTWFKTVSNGGARVTKNLVRRHFGTRRPTFRPALSRLVRAGHKWMRLLDSVGCRGTLLYFPAHVSNSR